MEMYKSNKERGLREKVASFVSEQLSWLLEEDPPTQLLDESQLQQRAEGIKTIYYFKLFCMFTFI